MVVKALAVGHDESCRATHTNMLLVRPTFFKNPIRVVRTFLGFVGLPGGYPAHEMQELRDMQIIDTEEMGYFKLQGTKPHVSRRIVSRKFSYFSYFSYFVNLEFGLRPYRFSDRSSGLGLWKITYLERGLSLESRGSDYLDNALLGFYCRSRRQRQIL